MQTGGLKPLFAIKMEKVCSKKTTIVQLQPQRKIPPNEGMTIFSIAEGLGPRVPMKFMGEKNQTTEEKITLVQSSRGFQSSPYYRCRMGLLYGCRFQPTATVSRRRSRRRPRGLKGGRVAADQGRSPQGRADLRALQGPGRRRRQAPKNKKLNRPLHYLGPSVFCYG